MTQPDRATFLRLASRGDVVPLVRRLMSDQITPVQAYRRLVSADERTAPSFLLESVEGGRSIGRFSYLAAQPAAEVLATGRVVSIIDHRTGSTEQVESDDPLDVLRRTVARWQPAGDAPEAFHSGGGVLAHGGGWVGYAGYDTARYLESEKLPVAAAPLDDRGLPDLHFGLYRRIVVFDHVEKLLYAMQLVVIDEHGSPDAAYDAGLAQLDALVERLERSSVQLPIGSVELDLAGRGGERLHANFTRAAFEDSVDRCRRYIAAGDAFQIVLSQRFERRTAADPFDVYRALRVVNPSPYMIYLQARGAILVASSPEILCHVEDGRVTSRPLAGTRRRGATPEDDAALEVELRGSEKERAEHVMLVDLARNDLGRVCETASITLQRVLEVERYSHVMHLSSTVTGRLRGDLDCWDALRATLPVGTVSGAPKVRAMQIIDELEPTRRGPYGGGIGVVGLTGDMDMALALRTMVIPTAGYDGGDWTVHLQAGAGIVADSDPRAEYEETVNKAAALDRAIDLAEGAFAR